MGHPLCVAGLLLGLLALAPALGAQETVVTSRKGQISALRYGSEYMEFSAGVRLPRRGWQGQAGLGDVPRPRTVSADGRTTWRGRIPVTPETGCMIEQTLEVTPRGGRLTITLTAEQDLDVEGAFFFVNVPIETFAGGTCELENAGQQAGRAELPVELPEGRHFLSGDATGIRMTSADGGLRWSMDWDRTLYITVQDTREWNGTTYNPYVTIAPGPMEAGQTASITIDFRAEGTEDVSPARLSLDAGRERYPLDGFGGNYCFSIDSPVTQYTLDNLNVRWARTEFQPNEWDWQRGDGWQVFTAQDTPGSALRGRMELAQQLHARGIPYVMSVWNLPERLYAEPGKGRAAHGRHVPKENWPEVAESIGAYLLYGKEAYGVEPDLFSFNEPAYGVRVKLTPEEHRDVNRLLGAHFESLGLKTRMLLADLANPRQALAYVQPTVDDPEAWRHVGALAYHSWGGASPERYTEWADLAERLGLPLLITELGVDANWREVPLQTFHYALREVRLCQELLLHARMQGTMQWEFTSDYSTVALGRDAEGKTVVTPLKRFWFLKHFTDLTPTPGVVLATASDHANVLITAVRSREGETYAAHVANFGAGRQATIAGIPPGRYLAVRTSETESYEEIAPIEVAAGDLTLALAPNSLLTLVSEP